MMEKKIKIELTPDQFNWLMFGLGWAAGSMKEGKCVDFMKHVVEVSNILKEQHEANEVAGN